MRSDTPKSMRRSVYDGQDRGGDFEQRDDGQYVARDRRGKALGTYDTAHEAIQAVLDEAAP
jgi:hypothetical protein